MRVLATRRNHDDPAGREWTDEILPFARWHELLARSDYIVNCLPFTPSNQGLFGEAEFRAMQAGACFINVGRGKTVREAVLVRALKEGWIASAGLDVFEIEPLPAHSELWSLPNVLVSPHCADQTDSYYEASARLLCGNVRRYLAGLPLENVADKHKGY
jgi:phosphoglycerate dehydrogenase-like enzyme